MSNATAPVTEQFEVRNRWTNAVQFTATIEVTPDMLPSVKLGLAVKWGRSNGADLSSANLRGAYLSSANLRGADLSSADLSSANLRGANLRGANLRGANLRGAKNLSDSQLRHVIADYWMILTMARGEVPALVAALEAGRVNGSTYSGDCACLVGTLENAGASGLPHVGSSPAEAWFISIREGDKPGDDSRGGFAATKALEWAQQWCAASGVALAAQVAA